MTAVMAPVAGRIVALADVPDPVFAAGMVGAGVAIAPDGEGPVGIASPVAGKILRIMPHALVVITPENRGVLVHVGIDTVQLKGEGFVVHGEAKQRVEAGEVLITADVTAIRAAGFDPICPVVIMESSADDISDVLGAGTQVGIGDPLFRL